MTSLREILTGAACEAAAQPALVRPAIFSISLFLNSAGVKPEARFRYSRYPA